MVRARHQLRAGVALAIGRAAGRLSLALGRGSGTMIGGRTALALDPSILSALAQGRTTVLVTGTNGKSTVTALVAAALGDAGAVVTNGTGANMPDGSVTALAADRVTALAALEVDELPASARSGRVHDRRAPGSGDGDDRAPWPARPC